MPIELPSFVLVHRGKPYSHQYHKQAYFIQLRFLGPRPFILYTADLRDVTKEHRVTIGMFTDDTQLYIYIYIYIYILWSRQYSINHHQNSIMDINHWMSAFVMSQVDYCNVVFDRAPKSVTSKLQRAFNCASVFGCLLKTFFFSEY